MASNASASHCEDQYRRDNGTDDQEEQLTAAQILCSH